MKSLEKLLNEMNTTLGGRRTKPLINNVPSDGLGLVFQDHSAYQLAKYQKDRFTAGEKTFSSKFTLGCKAAEFVAYVKEHFVVSQDGGSGVAFRDDLGIFITFNENRDALTIIAYGAKAHIDVLEEDFKRNFPASPCFIDWVYDPQYLESISMNLNTENIPTDDMYPFLNGETLASYYERFANSSANILVLIGAPGTGKTSFIRGLLAHTQKSATLTYNRKIVEQDSFFVEWYNSKNDYMVLEDSDTLLLPREDGNDLMARFLNIGDGLMTIKNKKIIFSTNLPNVGDIDPALVRPGRCFDILEFGALDREQAAVLCDKMNLPLPEGNKMTLAEIFASTKNEVKRPHKKFGFI